MKTPTNGSEGDKNIENVEQLFIKVANLVVQIGLERSGENQPDEDWPDDQYISVLFSNEIGVIYDEIVKNYNLMQINQAFIKIVNSINHKLKRMLTETQLDNYNFSVYFNNKLFELLLSIMEYYNWIQINRELKHFHLKALNYKY